MRRAPSAVLAATVSFAAAVSMTFTVGAVPAAAVTAHWTQLSSAAMGFNHEPGIVRTADGKLHLAWVQENSPNDWDIATVVLSPAGKVLGRGWAVRHWALLQTTPKLVARPGGVAVVFDGEQDANIATNPYSLNARYWATSTDGNIWTLQPGSLSSKQLHDVNIAATTEADGTLVSADGQYNQLFYDVGSTPASPSSTPDSVLTAQPGAGIDNPQLVRASDGSIWMGWYQEFDSNQGYWAQQILPTLGTPMRAPSSFLATQFNKPVQQVAMVARPAGGVYMAYCEPRSSMQCARIGLWKVGSAKALSVPGSGLANRITLSSGPGGRLEVAWFSPQSNRLSLVWTNHKATAFSSVRSLNPVSHLANLNDVFIDGSKGPVDVISNVQLTTTGLPTELFHTQVLPALKLTASPASFSHSVRPR